MAAAWEEAIVSGDIDTDAGEFMVDLAGAQLGRDLYRAIAAAGQEGADPCLNVPEEEGPRPRVFRGSGSMDVVDQFHLLDVTLECPLSVDYELTLHLDGTAALFLSRVPGTRNLADEGDPPDYQCVESPAQLYSGSWSGEPPSVTAEIVFGSTDTTFTVTVVEGAAGATASTRGAYTTESSSRSYRSEWRFDLPEVLPED